MSIFNPIDYHLTALESRILEAGSVAFPRHEADAAVVNALGFVEPVPATETPAHAARMAAHRFIDTIEEGGGLILREKARAAALGAVDRLRDALGDGASGRV